jgi:hypothetical protein
VFSRTINWLQAERQDPMNGATTYLFTLYHLIESCLKVSFDVTEPRFLYIESSYGSRKPVAQM